MFHYGFTDELIKLATQPVAGAVARYLKYTHGAVPGAAIGAIASGEGERGSGALKGALAGLAGVQGGRFAVKKLHKHMMKNPKYRARVLRDIKQKAKRLQRRAKRMK